MATTLDTTLRQAPARRLATEEGEHSRQVAAFLALCATLPLQWQSLATTPVGDLRYFHLTAIFFLFTFLGSGWAAPIAKQSWTVNGLAAVFTAFSVSMVAFSVLHGRIGQGVDVLQQYFYAVVGYFVALLIVHATPRASLARWMWWAAPAALMTFALFFAHGLQAQGISVVATLQRAFATADARIINFSLFKSAFSAAADDAARANMRYEIFAALLVCSLLSLWAMRLNTPRPAMRLLLRASIAASVVLTVLSLSRAVVLALLIAAAIPVVQFVFAGARDKVSFRWYQIFLVPAVVAISAPAWNLVETRFIRDTTSYEVRTESAARILDSIGQSPVVGAYGPTASAHNMVLDAWYAGGVVTGFLALIFVLLLAIRLLTLLGRYFKGRDRLIWVALAAVILPFVRIFTSGGGQLHLTQWVSLGLSMGILQLVVGPKRRTTAKGSGKKGAKSLGYPDRSTPVNRRSSLRSSEYRSKSSLRVDSRMGMGSGRRL